MNVNEKISALRVKMREHGIDAYLVLSEDAHQSEYVAGHWRCREWISGFDGSAGSVAITQDKAVLWADGRYYIQAAKQIAGSGIQMIKIGSGDADVQGWLADELSPGAVVGLDGRTLSVSEFERYEAALKTVGAKFELSEDLVGELWDDRPGLPQARIFEHDVKFAGRTRSEKLEKLRAELIKKGADCYFISSLDDIAWLFNLRGSDIDSTPVFYGFAFIDMTNAYLFVDPVKIDDELRGVLEAEHATLLPYTEVEDFLRTYKNGSRMFIDPDRINVYLKSLFPENIELIRGMDITTALKAVKNETELRNIENSQKKDGVVMVKFIKWVKEAVKVMDLEEADIHDKLMDLRSEQEYFIGESFGTIAGYMENAASMHYSPVKGKSSKLKPSGILLVDTGGQYLDGTTDITRTIVLGEVSKEIIQDFTLTLKAHIALASARFMYGAHASYLDAIPRRIMWDQGMDYKCGTGHGLGYFLSVHEGPQRFRMTAAPVTVEPGMITTNEPGVYKEGLWGIRTENTILAVDDRTTSDGRFLRFETLSYCPIDLAGIDVSSLTSGERDWLNDYHATVYAKLSGLLDDEHREWLKHNTRAV